MVKKSDSLISESAGDGANALPDPPAIDPEDQIMSWSSQTTVPTVTRDELLSLDYFGRPYSGDEVTVGPFVEGWGPGCRQLKLNGRDGQR